MRFSLYYSSPLHVGVSGVSLNDRRLYTLVVVCSFSGFNQVLYCANCGSTNKRWDFFFSTVNLHARLMKSRTNRECPFVSSFATHFRGNNKTSSVLLGNVRRLSKHAWAAQFRRLQWQHIYTFRQILIYGHAICL